MRQLLERFLEVLNCVDRCFVGPDIIENLSTPTKVGRARVGGIDLNSPGARCVAKAILALSIRPGGFSTSEIAGLVRAERPPETGALTPRQAAYDLQKFQQKGLLPRSGRRRRYSTTSKHLRVISALLLIRDRVLLPLLAAAENEASKPTANSSDNAVDQLYRSVRKDMKRLLHHLGLAAHDQQFVGDGVALTA